MTQENPMRSDLKSQQVLQGPEAFLRDIKVYNHLNILPPSTPHSFSNVYIFM